MKLKIISGLQKNKVEERVNDFIKDVNVIDIKFSTSTFFNNVNDTEITVFITYFQ